MSRSAELRQSWLEFLARHETGFNEELHLLTTGRKAVECVPPDGIDSGSGWFLVHADTQAGEWNLAHAFGPWAEYVKHLDLFPENVEFHLLVPVVDSPEVASYLHLEVSENLTWFRDASPGGALPGRIAEQLLPAGVDFLSRRENADGLSPENETVPYDAVYARENGSVIGLVRCIHLTQNTAEVYIETSPGWRNRGIGTRLLREMLKTQRNNGHTLLYVVSTDNAASLRLAGKAGLKPFQTLSRFRFTRSG